MRLHQSHRPLKQDQPGNLMTGCFYLRVLTTYPVCPSRKHRSRFSRHSFPTLGLMGCIVTRSPSLVFYITIMPRSMSLDRVFIHDVHKHLNRIRNENHMYDATEIFRTLSGHKKESFMKLGFYLLSCFYYLYRCISPLPLPPSELTSELA